MKVNEYPALEKINSPNDLRRMNELELPALAAELRAFLVESVSNSGGHLSAGLGTVELTIALHYIFETPDDRLVWDVGHQTYPHKILTGRRARMPGLRKKGGLSGFPKRSESEFDAFGVGHAGTSVSAALGMALSPELKKHGKQAIAVIGDGALTAGMAFEALNHAGHTDADLLVVVNDNNMSISANVGALSNHLTRILSGKLFTSVRESGKRVLSHMPPMKELARRAEEHVKGMVSPGTLFEELGFHYFGPVDGHDLPVLLKVLGNLKSQKGPRLLHVITNKGRGYAPAEADPVTYHGVSPFNPEEGVVKKTASKQKPTYTEVFSDWLCDMAAEDERLVGITPAMSEGSGLVAFSKRFPERYHDVGIAEQHAVTFAAGLACEGLKPVVAIYSTFLQRAYDQVIHDVAIQGLPMLFAVDRAGLVGPDGATHGGNFDISFLRCIPDLVLMAPADEDECRQMLYSGYRYDCISVVRYPRGRGPGVDVKQAMTCLPMGKAEVRRKGESGVVILAFGCMLAACMEAGSRLDATVVNMRFIKPLDETLLLELAQSAVCFVTVEDNVVAGGAGSGVNEYLAASVPGAKVLNLGLPDRFVDHGERGELLAEQGLDAEGIRLAVESFKDKL